MFSRPLEEGMKRELAAKGADHATSLSLIDGISVDCLHDRVALRQVAKIALAMLDR